MVNRNNFVWNIPFFFFVFLSLFILLKFIFIFFFRAAFEPQFLFDLTPLYVLTGIDNLQLLFLSIVIVLIDTYLHINPTPKNIKKSFLPTIVILSGLGFGITTKEIGFSTIPQYILFGFFLAILLIDHRRTLLQPQVTPRTAPSPPTPLFVSSVILLIVVLYLQIQVVSFFASLLLQCILSLWSLCSLESLPIFSSLF